MNENLVLSILKDNIVGKLVGDEYVGLCPFHNDKQPSFSINIQKQVWCCFAGCGSGKLADFLQKLGIKIDESEFNVDFLEFLKPKKIAQKKILYLK